MRAPCSAARARVDVAAARSRSSAPIALQALDVLVTGRAPIAQPPGSDTSRVAEAREQRAEHEDRRAHRLHELVRRDELADPCGVDRDTACRVARSTATPMRRSSFTVVVTSFRCGTLPSDTAPSASSVAARIGNAAFFAPEICTSPSRRTAPVDRELVQS